MKDRQYDRYVNNQKPLKIMILEVLKHIKWTDLMKYAHFKGIFALKWNCAGVFGVGKVLFIDKQDIDGDITIVGNSPTGLNSVYLFVTP